MYHGNVCSIGKRFRTRCLDSPASKRSKCENACNNESVKIPLFNTENSFSNYCSSNQKSGGAYVFVDDRLLSFYNFQYCFILRISYESMYFAGSLWHRDQWKWTWTLSHTYSHTNRDAYFIHLSMSSVWTVILSGIGLSYL